MANITYVDDYTMITFSHNNNSVMIYIENPMDLRFFQIEMLEGFFKRMMFYCGVGSSIDINIKRLKDDEVNIIGYFYNKNQDYDFCGTFENTFTALHNALSALFDLSVCNEHPYTSIDNDYDYGSDDDYPDDDYPDDDDSDDGDIKENSHEVKINDKKAKDLAKLGKAIDAIFKNRDKKNGNR